MKFKLMTVIAAAAGMAFAEGDADTESDAVAEAAEKLVQADAKRNENKAMFKPLPICRLVNGLVEVKKPLGNEWIKAEEGRYYPLGTTYRTREGGKLEISFGPSSTVTISGDASFSTRPEKLGVYKRTIVLGHGELTLDLARNIPEGAVTVVAPGFTVKNPAGNSVYKYSPVVNGDGDEAMIKCVTGSLLVEGMHFTIPAMHAADGIKIRTSQDKLNTFLYGISGDYVVKLDQGDKTRQEFNDDGTMRTVVEKGFLDWNLSPQTKVRIGRMMPSLGERMSVTMMTFDATGELKNNFAYTEGRAEVNSGELVAASKDEKEKLAAAAREAAKEAEAGEGKSDSEDEGDSDEEDSASDESEE